MKINKTILINKTNYSIWFIFYIQINNLMDNLFSDDFYRYKLLLKTYNFFKNSLLLFSNKII